MAKLAFLGTGKMGSGMAARLLDAGHSVSVWNRNSAKAEPLARKGAAIASTPAEAAKGAVAIFSMVADDLAAESVWLGAAGAMPAAAPGTLVIECSTLSSNKVGRLSTEAKRRDLDYVDCPVTGLPPVAAAGQLMLLVGAEPEVLERARPLLLPLCKAIRHFGGIGTGTNFKLINNLLGAVHIAALAEAVALAERLGLDKEAVIASLETGAIASAHVVRLARPMVTSTYSDTPPFSIGLRHKDAAYCIALSRDSGVPMPIGEAATSHFAAAKDTAFDDDEARLVETVRASVKRAAS